MGVTYPVGCQSGSCEVHCGSRDCHEKADPVMTREEALLERVPLEFRSTISYMAYERSHAYGVDEVFNTMTGLVNDLQPAIHAYGLRVAAGGKL